MKRTVEAVYDNGVFRPLEPLELADQEHVMLVVQSGDDEDWLDNEPLESVDSDSGPVISLEEMRRQLSKVPGCWSDDIIAERGEY